MSSSVLAGKTALVTGVTSGIGKVLTRRLLEANVPIIGVAREADKLAAVADEFGASFVPVLCDLSRPEERSSAIEGIVSRVERLDVLVNNAAEVIYESPLSLELDRWRSLLETNLLAGVELCRALAPRMAEGGHIVNTSSVTARFLP